MKRKSTVASGLLLCAIFIAAFYLPACKSNKAEAKRIERQVEIPKDEAEFQQKFSIVLEEYVKTIPAISIEDTRYMNWCAVARKMYEENKFTSLWLNKSGLTPKGKEMLDFLGTVEFLGLNKALYHYEVLQQLADSAAALQPNVDFNLEKQLESGLTRSFLQVALHVDHGMFSDTVKGINSNFWNSDEKYRTLLNKAATDSIHLLISTLEPDNPLYNRYMKALRAFVSKNNISSTPINIRDPKKDSLGAVEDARKALVYHHYLIDTLRNVDSVYIKALKKFQWDNNLNGDGAIGANTVRALERDNSKKFQLLAINADRWRKEHIMKLPAQYVWVNLPSYRLKIIEDDTLRLEKKVVIGKATDRAETPILESAINQVVLWPTWTVPQNIIKKEMKSFKGFIVTRKGNSITVVQPPGLKNALGSVKLLFPNKYSVYMHDTPAKSLFNADLRAASHGCVRCQDALEVAANLMMMDTSLHITYDSLKALRDEQILTRTFRLKKAIPVYFRYFTAEADFDGSVKFYADVYKRDKEMIDFIFNGRKPHVPTKREIQYADSMTVIRKKKNDSILAITRLKEKERLLTAANDSPVYSPKEDTTSAKQDSLKDLRIVE